jgi:DNA repair protein SbcC/Rad50
VRQKPKIIFGDLLKLKLDSETLRAKLLETGFQGEFLRPSSDIETFDLVLGTDCYQAFFKVVGSVDNLKDIWSKAQIQLAEYKNRRRVPRDLFLVLLITDSINGAGEDLIREITSDAMVCRKIVLPVPGGNLNGTLQGLPFVGLELSGTKVAPGIKHILSVLETKGYPGEVINTLTSRLAVDRRLASLIVLPVPDVVPYVTNTDYSLEPRSIFGGNRCRLASLSITDFRGLRIIDHLDLSSNLTIIFGLNGTGKTSLFDALEFALLGEVDRLESEAPDDLTKRSPYVNLFSNSAKVELQLKVGGTPITVERTATSTGERALLVDHEPISDEHDLLNQIVGEQQIKVDIRNLRGLMRTSNFLSQATLRQFLSDSPTERYWSLSHLLGTQDYTRLIEKIYELREALKKKQDDLIPEIAELNRASKELDSQIDARRIVLSESPEGRDLAAALSSLSARTVNQLRGIESPFAELLASASANYREIKSALSIVNEWLGAEQQRERIAQDNLKLVAPTLNQIADGQVLRSRLSSEIDSARSECVKTEKDLQPYVTEEEALRVRLRDLNGRIQKLNGRNAQLRQASDIAKELNATETLDQEQTGELDSAKTELTRLQLDQTKLSGSLSELEQQKATTFKLLSEARRQSEKFAQTETLVNSWLLASVDVPAVEQQLRSVIASTTEREKQRVSLLEQSGAFTQELESVNAELQARSAEMEQLHDLLVKLQKHVTGSECPLCGHDWKEANALLLQVENKTKWVSPDVRNLIARQQELTQKIDLTQRAISAINQQLAQSRALKGELDRRQQDLRVLNSEARNRVDQLLGDEGLPFTKAAELILGVRERAAQELDQLTQQSSALDSQARELRFELDHQQELLSMAQKRLSRIADVVRSTKQRSAGLRNQIVTLDVGSGPDFLLTIGEIDKKTQSELTELTAQRQQIEKQTVDCKSNRTNLESKLASGRQRLAQLTREFAQTEDGLAKAMAVVRFAGLKPDATPEEVSELSAKSQDRMRNIDKAIQQIAELASVSEWLIAREERQTLEAQLLQLRAKIDGLADQLSLHQKWHDHLSTLALSLLDAKSKTENQQLENYEPTINLLYHRLNPHPLFGAIRILIDAAEQSLRINFEVSKKSGSPYDNPTFSPMKYFSEAQLNLLALSIFLSHSFQQQWSIFVPLMLDDPVQNMDDLNVNGFIDCLRGFAALDKQFVISTCDINFYRLMLLKLRCLNQDGQNRFSAYRLEGFSQEGPQVIQDFPIKSIPLKTPAIA